MKKRIDNDKILDTMMFNEADVVSHQETTGLIPALAENDYEFDSYKEIDKFSQKPISDKEPDYNPQSQG